MLAARHIDCSMNTPSFSDLLMCVNSRAFVSEASATAVGGVDGTHIHIVRGIVWYATSFFHSILDMLRPHRRRPSSTPKPLRCTVYQYGITYVSHIESVYYIYRESLVLVQMTTRSRRKAAGGFSLYSWSRLIKPRALAFYIRALTENHIECHHYNHSRMLSI
jgi:hypothetical protein